MRIPSERISPLGAVIAMAAVAGAAAWLLLRHRASNRRSRAMRRSTARGYTVEELIGDTNMVSSGDAAKDQGGSQPQDWRGEPIPLDVTVLDPPGHNQGFARFGKADY